jgi:hypothetical protein
MTGLAVKAGVVAVSVAVGAVAGVVTVAAVTLAAVSRRT